MRTLLLGALLGCGGANGQSAGAGAEVNEPVRVVAQAPDPTAVLVLAARADALGTTISVELADGNERDKLFVRLFADYDLGRFQVVRTSVSPPVAAGAARRPVEFPNLHCSDLLIEEPGGAGGSGGAGVPVTHLLEVVVSDREFDDASGAVPTNRRGASDGFLVTAYWRFTCG